MNLVLLSAFLASGIFCVGPGSAAPIHDAASSHFGWRPVQASPPSNLSHTLKFWLHADQPTLLHDALLNVSDPRSLLYRAYLTDEAISELVAPPQSASQALRRWLDAVLDERYSLTMSKHSDFALVTASVVDWGRVFGGELVWHRHPLGRAGQLLRLKLSSPRSSGQHLRGSPLEGVVRAVFGLSDFYPVMPPTQQATDCHQFKGDQIDPDVIAKQYGTSAPPASGRPGLGKHSQGVAAFEDAEFAPSDVAQFQSDYKLSNVNVSIIGPNNGGYYGEASLDTQYIFSTGSGVSTWYLSQQKFDLLEWSWTVMNMTRPPSVLSVSWGSGESGFDSQHQHAASAEFAKMGLKGITILAASGDDGTGGTGGIFGCKRFDPTWPASSPYVTAVGATYLDTGSEMGWSSSGGGFSAVFSQPEYQSARVDAYLNSSKLPASSLFNGSGRATPDVAAVGTNFKVLSLGAYGCISGTSASTPVFAGMVSVINDQLVSAGKPTAGFLNPTLYSAGGVGFDVLVGNNKKPGCSAGFEAQAGYDAVTGLGTPLMKVLSSVLID